MQRDGWAATLLNTASDMLRRLWVETALVGGVLLAAGCAEDDKTGPGERDFPSALHTAGQCVAAPSGMTGWWPGDGNTGDIVGGRNAVLRGDATTGPGLVSDAFVLDGDGDFVDVAHDAALNVGTGDFTVDLWVNFNTTEGEQVLVEKWIQRFDPNASEGWTLTKLPDNVLLLAMADGSGPEDGVATDVLSIATGTWIHFAATRQGDLVTLYVNGVPAAQGTSSMNLNSQSSLKFGRRGTPADTPGSEEDREVFLNGRIDEVELFVGRALSDDKIAAIHAAGSAGKCKPRPTSLVLTPRPRDPEAVNPVGTSHTVTATLRGARGRPVPGFTVQFRVLERRRTFAGNWFWAPYASGSCLTAAGGQCSFTYQGPTQPRDNLIGAWADTDNDNTRDRGEPAGSTAKRWVS